MTQPPPPGWAPPPGHGFGAPPPQKKRRTGWWIAGGVAAVVVVAAAAAAGSSGDDKPEATQQQADSQDVLDHREDVKITKCGNDQYGGVAASIVITNQSSKRSTYSVTIAFTLKADGRQIATGYAGADQLAPGQQSTPQEAVTGQTADGPYTCTVADATRFASG